MKENTFEIIRGLFPYSPRLYELLFSNELKKTKQEKKAK